MDHPLDLLRVRDDLHVLLHIVEIAELHTPLLQLQSQILGAVVKVVVHREGVKIVGDAVRVDLGVEGQLVDESVHLPRLVVDGADIFFQLLRGVRHAVHDTLGVALDGGHGGLQVVGNVADELLILFIKGQLLLRVGLQSLAHLLKVTAQLSQLVVGLPLHLKVQVSLLDVLGRLLHPAQGLHDSPVDPEHKQRRRKDKHQGDDHQHVHRELPDLRDHIPHVRDDKGASVGSVGVLEINLFHKDLYIPPIIEARVRGGLCVSVGRQLAQHAVQALHLLSHIGDRVVLAHDKAGFLVRQHIVKFCQVGGVLQLVRLCQGCRLQLMAGLHGELPQHLHRVGQHLQCGPRQAVGLLDGADLVSPQQKDEQGCEHHRHHDNCKKCNDQSGFKLHSINLRCYFNIKRALSQKSAHKFL